MKDFETTSKTVDVPIETVMVSVPVSVSNHEYPAGIVLAEVDLPGFGWTIAIGAGLPDDATMNEVKIPEGGLSFLAHLAPEQALFLAADLIKMVDNLKTKKAH